MNIALIIYSLSAGGAERVMSTIANCWSDKGWDVTLLWGKVNHETRYFSWSSLSKACLKRA